MQLNSYGKINLGLDVISRREDGYHNIKTIMQSIDLYDVIHYKTTKSGFSLSCNNEKLSIDKDNLIYKAWDLMCRLSSKDLGIEIYLEKNLPIGAGLAGGTSNGAMTLHALNKLYNLNYDNEKLAKEALKLGADFPFCINGGRILCEGIGEVLTPLKCNFPLYILIVNPGFQVCTKDVYENLLPDEKRIDFEEINYALNNNINRLKNKLENKLESVVTTMYKIIDDIKEELIELGAIESSMSGSGPTVFGVFKDERSLDSAYDKIFNKYSYVQKSRTIGGII